MKNEERVSATRARLIEAAIAALAEVGYHRTTFVEVSRRSDLSRGAIHHHFDSIPDLMAAVTRHIAEQIQQSVRDGLQHVPPGSDVFDFGIDFVWDQMRAPPFLALNQIRTALATDESLRNSVRDEVIDVAEWLQGQARSIVAERSTGANSAPIDFTLIRLVLSSLAGAASYDSALGAPPEDPDRSAYRATLKQVVKLYNADKAASVANPVVASALS